MKIILDAMGGDNAPQAVVQGALEAHAQCGADIVLVGREEAIRACLTGPLPEGVEIVNATEVVEMCDDPATAFKRKKDSSLTVGLTMLKNGEGDAFISAGSTGALLAGATLLVKRIRGVRRAAMGPVLPTATGRALLCDCGANADCTPEYLLQFAYLGNFYAQRLMGVEKPRVGLLNIGSEPSKGDTLRHETYALLEEAGREGRSELHRQHRGQHRPAGRGRRHRGGRLFRQYPAENRGGRRQAAAGRDEEGVSVQHEEQAGRPAGQG